MARLIYKLFNSVKGRHLVLAAIPIFMSFVWFKGGRFIAAGEEGLWLYNPARTLAIYSSPWSYFGVGRLAILSMPRLPITFFAYLLGKFITNYQTQGLIFLLAMYSAVFGTYYLTIELTKDRKIALFASLFYFLNLFTMSQVFYRLIYAGIFTWAYLPLFLFLSIKWLMRGNKQSLFLLLGTNLFFARIYSNIAFVFTLLIPLLFWSIGHLRQMGGGQNILIFIRRGFALLFLLALLNFWWIYLFLTLGEASLPSARAWETSYYSLLAISDMLKISNPLTLYHTSMMSAQGPWGMYYSSGLISKFAYIPIALSFLGWRLSRNKTKYKNISFLVPMFFSVFLFIILVKFEVFQPAYKYVFQNLLLIKALRNPYEKLGSILVLGYSVFFAIAVNHFLNMKTRLGKFTAYLTLFLVLGVVVKPMWTGGVFVASQRVEVPVYYTQANDYIKNTSPLSRILVLPLTPGEGAQYSWGYSGIETSNYLFDNRSISVAVETSPDYNKKYKNLLKLFTEGENPSEALEQLAVDYIVLNFDFDWESQGAKSPQYYQAILESNPDIKYVDDFGNLKLYRFMGGDSTEIIIARGNSPPQISYEKISSAKYHVKINEVSEPYVLIFKEAYNTKWRAKVNNEVVDDHFQIYDYANAWEIQIPGSYTIEIEIEIWPWD